VGRLPGRGGPERVAAAAARPRHELAGHGPHHIGRLVRPVPSLAGIGSDIKKPGALELSYDRIPVRAAATLPALWRQTVQGLPGVTHPVLVYRSAEDHVVGPSSMRALEAGLRPGLLTVRTCHDSYHVATMDHDAQAIFTGSLQFVREHGSVQEHDGTRREGEART
jgi:carboxylesterase